MSQSTETHPKSSEVLPADALPSSPHPQGLQEVAPSQHSYHRPRMRGLLRIGPGPHQWSFSHASEAEELTTSPHYHLPCRAIPDSEKVLLCFEPKAAS